MSAAVDAAPCAVRLHAVRSSHSSVCKFLTALVSTVSKKLRAHKVQCPESNVPVTYFAYQGFVLLQLVQVYLHETSNVRW